ncbi:MAG: hypothetical protein AAB645_00640 [Patescibacteria group bacterium]
MPLKTRLAIQLNEIFSPFNKWVTGEKVEHNPTPAELSDNYIKSGRAAEISQTLEKESANQAKQ